MTSSPEHARRSTTCRRRCRRCGGCASSATAHEPRLLLVAFALALLAALPDALLALWLKLLGDGVLERRPRPRRHGRGDRRSACRPPRRGSCARVSTRVQRRFRDKVTIALESHVARLQASVATIAHQERPEYLDRLAVLRDQVFVLDHMYMSLFSTCGWILRLVVTVALLVSIHPALVLLALFALPTVLTSTWRPAVERARRGARRAARTGWRGTCSRSATTAPPGKEVRVTGIGERLVARAPRGVGALVRAGRARRAGRSARVAHAGVGDLRRRVRRRDRVRRRRGSTRRAGDVLLVLAAGRAALGVHRRHRRRDRLPARHLAGRRRGGWPGSRTTRRRSVAHADQPVPDAARTTASASSTSRSPIPAPTALVLDDVDARAAGRHGRRDRRRERRRQDARS